MLYLFIYFYCRNGNPTASGPKLESSLLSFAEDTWNIRIEFIQICIVIFIEISVQILGYMVLL